MKEKDRMNEIEEGMISKNSTDEKNFAVQDAKKEQRNSFFLAITALLAIILVCVAWFLNNQRVSMNNIEIQSAKDGFELAAEGSAGLYDRLLTYTNTGSDLTASTESDENNGENSSDDSGSDGKQETDGDGKNTVIGKTTDADNARIRWVMNADSNMNNVSGSEGTIQPGTSGKLTFYVIPKVDGTLKLNFNLQTDLYTDNERLQTDELVKKLVEGHILFFQKCEEEGESKYYDDIITDGKFSKTIPDAVAEKQYEYTIYWTWVYVFGQNLLPKGNKVIEPWVSDDVRKKLFDDMTGGNYAKYFYDEELKESKQIDSDKLESVYDGVYSSDDFIEISERYNDADEYIGEKVRYIVITLKAEKIDSGTN
jgi:hypothetical protein